MSEFRILDENLCFDAATQFLPTSEDSAFPAENMRHPFRAKSWRSYGFFRITSSNAKLDFKDAAGGTEYTATVPSGEYTAEDLETLIAGRMALAGTQTYTVSFSRASGKWTISTSGTELQLLSSTGTNVANGIWATLGFSSASDYTGDTEHVGAYVAIHTEERLVIDTGNEDDVDSFAMVFDPDTGHKFSASAVVKLLASSLDSWYGTPEVEVTLSVDDIYGCITHFFSSAQNYRYWCVKIVDPQNPYLYVEVPKVVLCKATQLSQVPSIGFSETVQDQSIHQSNDYGHVYSDINPNRRRLRLSYDSLAEDDLETLQEVFRRNGTVNPIGVALDSAASLFDKDRFFLYGRMSRDAESSHVFYSYFNTGLMIEEAF